jgi:hypothetical protein
MNLPQTIFTLPEQQLNPPDNGSFKEAERFEDKVQGYMSSMGSADTALVLAEHAKRLFAEEAVERMMGY